MTDHTRKWTRVSRPNPCPKCGKPDNCTVSVDECWCWCGRISKGSIRENAGGQHLHQLKDSDHAAHAWNPNFETAQKQPEGARDWGNRAQHYAQNAALRIQELSQQLGVSFTSLSDLGTGWSEHRQCWTFPERNGEGKIIGISTRDRAGQKNRTAGGKAGLTFASDWKSANGPIFLVEGASDVAALRTIGLAVVGRPSNRGGIAFLTNLLFDVLPNREIIVVGERDEKPDGRWPGKEGAINVATQLAEALERPIRWAFPPDDAKDSRAWFQSMPELPVERLADLFITGIDTSRVDPPITLSNAPEPKNTLPLKKWRDTMLQARLQSLEKPGIYLDHSPTGAGKSRVDFEAIRALLQRGSAA